MKDALCTWAGVCDPQAARLSGEYDVAADGKWFEAHPGVEERTRLATALERQAFGLPPGSETVVIRLLGDQVRLFFGP